jgi:hypothetical protein
MGLGNLPEQCTPLRYSMVLLSFKLIPDSGKSGIRVMMGMGIMMPDPSPRQIGDGGGDASGPPIPGR